MGAILAHRPAAAEGLDAFAAARGTSTLGRRLSELVRLRIVFHNQCRSCMAVRYRKAVDEGVSEGAGRAPLERPMDVPDLTEAERAAVRFADLFATDHLAIDDAVYDDLRRYFDEGELVDLGLLCA